MKYFFSILLIILTLSLFSCNDNGLNALFEISRVVPGYGIDGVMLGDSSDDVEQKLGKDYQLGGGDGSDKTWIIYSYEKGEHKGLRVWFLEQFDSDGWGYPGPVDNLEVDSTFTGKTRDGIGVGSTIEDVHKFFGNPKEIRYSSGRTYETYCIVNRQFYLSYLGNVLRRFSIGHFITSPGDLCN